MCKEMIFYTNATKSVMKLRDPQNNTENKNPETEIYMGHIYCLKLLVTILLLKHIFCYLSGDRLCNTLTYWNIRKLVVVCDQCIKIK